MIFDTWDFAAGAVVQALGQTVTYDGTEGVPVVYGEEFRRVQSGEVRVVSTRPTIYVRYADMPNPFEDDEPPPPEPGHSVEIEGVLYEVVTVQQDTETVGAYLLLKKL